MILLVVLLGEMYQIVTSPCNNHLIAVNGLLFIAGVAVDAVVGEAGELHSIILVHIS